MYWHQTAARTSQTRIILQPTSNSHASLWSIPKQEMADCHVTLWVWAEHTCTTTTWHRSWGEGQGQDFSFEVKVKAKTWGAKAKAKTFMRCPQGSSRPRLGLEDNKTCKIFVEIWCSSMRSLPMWPNKWQKIAVAVPVHSKVPGMVIEEKTGQGSPLPRTHAH